MTTFFHEIFSHILILGFKIFSFSKYGQPLINCLICKKYVGAGIRTLISISDELDPSIFWRKIQKTWPLWKEMDEQVFISELAIFLCRYYDLVCKQLCFPPKKCRSRRNESTEEIINQCTDSN